MNKSCKACDTQIKCPNPLVALCLLRITDNLPPIAIVVPQPQPKTDAQATDQLSNAIGRFSRGI